MGNLKKNPDCPKKTLQKYNQLTVINAPMTILH